MYLEMCNSEQLKRIYDKFNTNEKLIRKDVSYLMEWLEQQPHLPKIKDETLLSHILLISKNSLERCKSKINSYYIFRAAHPELFIRDICSPELKTAILMMIPVPMPKLTIDGDRFFVWRLFELDEPHPIQNDMYAKVVTIGQDVTVKMDLYNKATLIIDLKNVSIAFIAIILAAWRKFAVNYKQFVILNSVNMYVINCSSLLEPFVKTIKLLLPKKQSEMFHILTDKNDCDVAEMFPECKSVMPSTYGGFERPIEELQVSFHEYLINNLSDWFIAENDVKADLSKIPADVMQSFHSLFGADGSFRKLTID